LGISFREHARHNAAAQAFHHFAGIQILLQQSIDFLNWATAARAIRFLLLPFRM